MKTVTVVLLVVVPTILTVPLHLRQPKEIRRQFVGYTTNLLHENPNFPDQTAQSTITVDFNPSTQDQPVYLPQHQNYGAKIPQSQLFNVGYSVSFRGEKPKVAEFRQAGLGNGDVITGTRKRNEEVQSPGANLPPQEFVSSAFLSTQKHKISGIKPKPQYVGKYQNPKGLISQANLSLNTQKFYKAIEQAKVQKPNNEALHQKYTWTNLGPGVEIIRSTEVPASSRYQRTEALNFDHAKALGRSQEFDQTNAIDGGAGANTGPQYFYQATRAQQPPNLPIDTTLLHDPVPIQVDARYVEEAMKNLYNYQNQDQASAFVAQPYRTIPIEETPNQATQLQVYQYQPEQSRYQYKIYGHPQPLSYADQEQSPRQPRFLKDINTHLRPPPPGTIHFQRRILMG